MVALLYKKLPGICVDSLAEGQSYKAYYKERRKEDRKFRSKRKKTAFFLECFVYKHSCQTLFWQHNASNVYICKTFILVNSVH